MASQLPICEAEVLVHTDYTIMSHLVCRHGLANKPLTAFTADDFFASTEWLKPPSSTADILTLHTCHSPSGQEWTEATHVHNSGLLVTVRPVVYPAKVSPANSQSGCMNGASRLPPASVIDDSKVLHKAVFYRMMSNPYLRELIRKTFSRTPIGRPSFGLSDKECLMDGSYEEQAWRNGEGNVYAVGGWPSDGLTLLESCVRTGLGVAEELGANAPFQVVKRTEF